MAKLTQFKRSQLFHLNKYQQQMMVPIFVCCFVSCFIILLSLLCLYAPDKVFTNVNEDKIQILIPIVLVVLSTTILFVVFWTYRISNRMVGAFDRIVKELDDILTGTRTKPIGTRRGDIMFEELLKRINALVEKTNK